MRVHHNLLHLASEAQNQPAQLNEYQAYDQQFSTYLHDIFDARFDHAECRACSQVAQKSDWSEEVAESKAMLRKNIVLLAIKVHPSSLQH